MTTVEMQRSAMLVGPYRYSLERRWSDDAIDARRVLWIMLNPSTADALIDDPTIRRCIGFSQFWGYPQLAVRNAFAFKATKPADMASAKVQGVDIVGPLNDELLLDGFMDIKNFGGLAVVAWGAHCPITREEEIIKIANSVGVNLHCLGLTKDGKPKHPLYIRADAPLVPFSKAA